GGSATCVNAVNDQGNAITDSSGANIKAASCGSGKSPPYCPVCLTPSGSWYNPAAACPACGADEYCDTSIAPTCTGPGTATCANGATPTCTNSSNSGTTTTVGCTGAGATATCTNGKPFCPGCLPKWSCSLACSNCPGKKSTNVWGSL